MSEKNVGIRGRIGEIKFYPKTEEKPAVAYMRIAEDVYEQPMVDENGAKKWAKPETAWHDVQVKGSLAEKVNAVLEDGDSVVVVGDRSSRVREAENGQKYTNVTIFADSVSPDLSRDDVVIDRDARERRRAARQVVSGDVAQEADQSIQAAPLVDPTWPTVSIPNGPAATPAATYAQ